MICENCLTESEQKYGSGRFCSVKCARGFSTKEKRKEINQKVSQRFQDKPSTDIEKFCEFCKDSFSVPFGKRKQKTCSRKCGMQLTISDPKYIRNLSNKRIQKIEEGVTNGNSIRCEYTTKNSEKIRCDSKLEYACLMFFEENYHVKSIARSKARIEYDHENRTRIYLPDFQIETENCTFIVECKSTKAGNDLREKWKLYIELSLIKRNLLDVYAKSNGLISFWFTEKTFKGYKTLKMPDHKKPARIEKFTETPQTKPMKPGEKCTSPDKPKKEEKK